MATVTFEKMDTNLFFSDRNKDPYPVLVSMNDTMCDENGVVMTDENGEEMEMSAEFSVKTFRVCFEKQDTNLLFGAR